MKLQEEHPLLYRLIKWGIIIGVGTYNGIRFNDEPAVAVAFITSLLVFISWGKD